ncbi:MAG: DNA gyrase inhibitor YacG [Pseudomonadales bacterium]|jgi:endogenous inhibitor of DNA gyrase (YacG/DUF329 family)
MTKKTSAASTPLVDCPTCGIAHSYDTSSPYRPFCSDRCKLIDLGEWASEGHAIPGEPVWDDMMSDELELKH